VPTEEQIERMEEKLEEAQSEQKNLYLIVFQVFPSLCFCALFHVAASRDSSSS
jgi:hypothetical protein